MKRTRILIADDHAVVRSGLKLLLRSRGEFSIVAEAADGEEAVRLVDKHKPDVAILDISMPKLDGIETTKVIKRDHPDVRILILTVHEEEEYAIQVLRAGASGYLLKNAGKKEIFEAVRSVASGHRFFSPRISNLIVDGLVKRAAGPTDSKHEGPNPSKLLTKRETEILQYIARGYTNRQIADELSLSFRTVNTHRANLMQKLDIHDTARLVRYAISIGIVRPES